MPSNFLIVSISVSRPSPKTQIHIVPFDVSILLSRSQSPTTSSDTRAVFSPLVTPSPLFSLFLGSLLDLKIRIRGRRTGFLPLFLPPLRVSTPRRCPPSGEDQCRISDPFVSHGIPYGRIGTHFIPYWSAPTPWEISSFCSFFQKCGAAGFCGDVVEPLFAPASLVSLRVLRIKQGPGLSNRFYSRESLV